MEEIEIKFLEVDVPLLEQKLLEIGAKKVREFQYKRVLLDYPDWRLEKDNSWLRLRTDGKETTLSYKQRLGVKAHDGSLSDDGMKEIEVNISDYNKTFEIFKSIGFVVKREQENRRVRYEKDDSVFDIDFWPKIPPYLELEAPTLEKVKESAREIGLDPKKGFMFSAKQVYARYGFNEDDYSFMTFERFTKR